MEGGEKQGGGTDAIFGYYKGIYAEYFDFFCIVCILHSSAAG